MNITTDSPLRKGHVSIQFKYFSKKQNAIFGWYSKKVFEECSSEYEFTYESDIDDSLREEIEEYMQSKFKSQLDAALPDNEKLRQERIFDNE